MITAILHWEQAMSCDKYRILIYCFCSLSSELKRGLHDKALSDSVWLKCNRQTEDKDVSPWASACLCRWHLYIKEIIYLSMTTGMSACTSCWILWAWRRQRGKSEIQNHEKFLDWNVYDILYLTRDCVPLFLNTNAKYLVC